MSSARELSELLSRRGEAGVYRLAHAHTVKEVEKAAKAAKMAFFHIEGAKIEKKTQFLNHAALALRFPEYFGNNWDAFEDCLTDLSWVDTEAGYVIYFDHVDPLLEHAHAHFETLLELFVDAVEYWKEQGRAMFVLLHGKRAKELNLPSW
jgi:RNAse (barnase) inhibitor barstar